MTMKRSIPGAARRFTSRARRSGALAMALGLGGLGLSISATRAEAKPAAKAHQSWFQVGKASWYGGKFNGRRTALGERFDMNALTCAHRTLPLGSWVRVTNLRNHRSTFLRVNDRGPMSESLVMDLSYAAAHRLGISGLGNVKIERVSKETVDRARTPHLEPHAPLLLMASNEYGVPVLPPIVADR